MSHGRYWMVFFLSFFYIFMCGGMLKQKVGEVCVLIIINSSAFNTRLLNLSRKFALIRPGVWSVRGKGAMCGLQSLTCEGQLLAAAQATQCYGPSGK